MRILDKTVVIICITLFLSQYVIKLMKLHIFKNAIIYSMKIYRICKFQIE